MSQTKRKRYQMAFDISEELHKHIKISSVQRNITMNMWMNLAIIHYIKLENHYNSAEEKEAKQI